MSLILADLRQNQKQNVKDKLQGDTCRVGGNKVGSWSFHQCDPMVSRIFINGGGHGKGLWKPCVTP